MKAYRNIRLTECPDIADIQYEGRKTSVGRILRGEKAVPRYKNGIVGYADGTPGIDLNADKIVHNDRGYCRPKKKKSVRRYLKRKDKAMEMKFQKNSENFSQNA
jgi:hypothetical protein